ncbi:MAG TPA: metallophosphoesterase [Tepidisphaeraceae bacterium]|nr:metallophosphoesterase [Tepidisphaeraceae bacterium]
MSHVPHRPSRRALLRTIAAGVAIPAGVGFYTWQVEPFWPEFHELPMPIAGLPAGLAGARVAHLTDLHVASDTAHAYVRGVVRQVNALRPDLVLITGDLVTHGRPGWLDRACDLVAQLKARAFVSFGNHDYGREALPDGRDIDVAVHLEERLTRAGHTVLRNRAASWGRGDQSIRIVGMEDLWSGRFAPAAAFADGPDTARPTIALSHNPDTATVVDGYRPSWILAGHTHGGQIRIPGYGALLLPIQQRRWQKGQFQLPSSRLYVSRGIGFLARTRFCCRPEVPIFTLVSA